MSTPDQPETPPLTRRQLREIRNTGATLLPTPEEIAESAAAIERSRSAQSPGSGAHEQTDAPAHPTTVDEASSPGDDAADDDTHGGDTQGEESSGEDVAGGQALGEETPDGHTQDDDTPSDDTPSDDTPAEHTHGESVADDHSLGEDSPIESVAHEDAQHAPDEPAPVEPDIAGQSPASEPVVTGVGAGVAGDLGFAPLTRRQAREQERIRTASVPIITPDAGTGMAAEMPDASGDVAPPPVDGDVSDSAPSDGEPSIDVGAVADDRSDPPYVIDDVPGRDRSEVDEPAEHETATAQVDPRFGSGLLTGAAPAAALPPSFDQLIARSATTGGSSSTPNALILSQAPASAPLDAPVTATGEVLITGTFDLPEGLGSVGHAPGIHDGKDVDAVLVDGELPAASSPTPVAASAAISTVRSSDEIIRPPAPEKGSRLVLILGIVTGVLGLTAIGAFVLAFTTGAL